MMTTALWLLLLAPVQETREPHVGYLYPAGGQQGSVVLLFAGGQILNGVKEVAVSGEGVRAKVVRYMGRALKLNGDERKEVIRRLKELKEGGEKKAPTAKLPNHPLLNDLEKLTPMELEFLINEFLKFDGKKQINNQIGETVLIEVTIDANAPPGDRELRLRTPLGMSNPMCFQVGRLPEIREPEPYNIDAAPGAAVDAPVTINGQIRPGDVDRFRIAARAGQQLVIRAQARHLIPFLADAVPGWFQATLALFDSKGKELAYDDDYRFDPDPVLFYKVPETGVVELEIHDSIYRGREDFVYRISVSEEPFVKSLFPLGGREGEETVASIDGWNLSEKRLMLDTRPGGEAVREMTAGPSNRVTYAVDTLPEILEVEPNDTSETAQRIDLPRTVNGRIAKSGDVDVFRFHGKAGDELVAEVLARRLQSPLDSLLRLTDASGRVVAWNDDLERKEGDRRTDMGAITHHADSYLRARLPEDGVYFVHLVDAGSQGGDGYGYRLRLGPARPDFALRVTPATLNVRGGVATPVTVYVLRKDGFDGEIALSLKDAPAGFALQGATIPPGCDRIRVTLTAPQKPPDGPIALRLEGSARSMTRTAVPCEDLMQAFLWRHLVPCRELVVTVLGAGMRPPEVAGSLPVRIPAGETAEVTIRTVARAKLDALQFELDDPPKGVTLQETVPTRDGLKLVLKADAQAQIGSGGNLIVKVLTEMGGQKKDGKPAKPGRRVVVGVLPAIPFRIVERGP
ncbi:MAG: hypothetical protein HYY17_07860 [Planctomycetes bacterium]|nr:hypothetical protein [Planctomycetota bacterium]